MSMQLTCVRIKEDTKSKLEKIAQKKRRKPTELIRIVLENYVEQFDDMQK